MDAYIYSCEHADFDPKSLVFDARHRRDILVSDAGIALAFAALGTWAHYRGIGEVIALYFVPYLIVNHHLVMVTFLQHTDPALPHYRDGEWNFQRGALCTVDRNTFGFVGPYLFHGIAETHVLHHLCSKIPHCEFASPLARPPHSSSVLTDLIDS